ncbi:MAG: 7-cyano-7-deazaguanine synthase QueC [Thermodesulfovibrionales bacterium]
MKDDIYAQNIQKAVVLLSGGIDSSAALAIAKSEGYNVYALSFDYNQRHKRELESAKMVASAFGVKKHLIINFDLREIGGSALTSEIEVPKKDRSQKTENRSQNKTKIKDSLSTINYQLSTIPITYVPARNTIFLSFALAWSEVLLAENIFIGANAIDYSGYPDCRPEYLKAFEEMANLATKISVEGKLRFKVNAPLISMKKSEIIRKGIELGLDFSLTWSCYDPQPPEKRRRGDAEICQSHRVTGSPGHLSGLIPCGRCDSCVFRAKGFKEAGIRDPLIQS